LSARLLLVGRPKGLKAVHEGHQAIRNRSLIRSLITPSCPDSVCVRLKAAKERSSPRFWP
jgi:hypothetical protein